MGLILKKPKMKTSEKGKAIIKKHEGLRLQAYKCPAGVLTIGYGHTRNVFDGQKISERDAEVLLAYDVKTAEDVVNRYVKVELNQNQFDALVSFVFNLGAGNFGKSTLLKVINKTPNDPAITAQFQRWINAGRKPLPGLVKRRQEEAKLYFEKC